MKKANMFRSSKRNKVRSQAWKRQICSDPQSVTKPETRHGKGYEKHIRAPLKSPPPNCIPNWNETENLNSKIPKIHSSFTDHPFKSSYLELKSTQPQVNSYIGLTPTHLTRLHPKIVECSYVHLFVRTRDPVHIRLATVVVPYLGIGESFMRHLCASSRAPFSARKLLAKKRLFTPAKLILVWTQLEASFEL